MGSYISDSTLDNIKNDESWKLQHIDVAFLEVLYLFINQAFVIHKDTDIHTLHLSYPFLHLK